MVFVTIMMQTRLMKSRYHEMSASNILDTVRTDAEIYFVAITMSHLLIAIVFATTSVGFLVQVSRVGTC